MKKNNREEEFKEKNIKNNQGKELMMIRSVNFSFISHFNKKLIGLNYLNNVINTHLFKVKSEVYINLLSCYYDIKDNDNYINIRKLLSNILLKKLINKKNNTLKYYFYKYRSNIFSLQNLNNQSTDLITNQYQEIISKISKENTQELMKLSNENLSLRTEINHLNEQLGNYKQKEKDVNSKIKEIKSQYNNFQKIIDDMNIKLDNLKKENISYKDKYDSLNNKYIAIVINYNSNKKELEKALKEMDAYSQLLLTLENKMNKAEIDKKKAEFERDNAIMETRNIRERYINIMSSNNNYL